MIKKWLKIENAVSNIINVRLSVYVYVLFVILICAWFTIVNGQQIDKITRKCPTSNVYSTVLITNTGDVDATPCPTRTTRFNGNVDFTNATIQGLPDERYTGGEPNDAAVTNYFFADDFIGGGAAVSDAASIWQLITSGTIDRLNEANHPGVFTFVPSNANRNVNGIRLRNITYSGSGTQWIGNNNFTVKTIAKLVGGTLSNAQFRTGLKGNQNSWGEGGIAGCWFEKLDTDTNFFARCDTGAATTRVDTNIAVALNTYYLFTIRRSGSTVYFSINNGTEIPVTTNIPSTPTNGSLIWLGVEIYLNFQTAPALYVDYASIALSGITRF